MNSYCSWKSRVGGKHGNGSLGTLAVPLDPTFTYTSLILLVCLHENKFIRKHCQHLYNCLGSYHVTEFVVFHIVSYETFLKIGIVGFD